MTEIEIHAEKTHFIAFQFSNFRGFVIAEKQKANLKSCEVCY
jgi:hypothetical protein